MLDILSKYGIMTSMRFDRKPNTASERIETFARRVYAPVVLGGVGIVSMLIGALVMRVMLSLLCSHAGVPSWAHALTTGLWVGGGWGVMALPFLYVVFGSFYGYAQRKENDQTERPVVRITALTRLIYGMICRVTLHIVSAVGGSTCSATSSSQARQIHLFAPATTQRDSHARPPRLRVGRAATNKEAGHVRLSMRTYTVAVITAGGTGA